MSLAIEKDYEQLLADAEEKLEAASMMIADTLSGPTVKKYVNKQDEFVVKTLLASLSGILESAVGVASALHEYINE